MDAGWWRCLAYCCMYETDVLVLATSVERIWWWGTGYLMYDDA